MNGKYLFLFDRLTADSTVDGNYYFLYGCLSVDKVGLDHMAQCIASNILDKIRTDYNDISELKENVLSDLNSLDYTCIAEDFYKILETFGLILVTSFKDLPSSPRAVSK